MGDARLTFADLNGNGVVDVPGDILQENHYYPFGMNAAYGWMNNATLVDNRYQYNGKELNDDFGVNLLDYGARWYDAALGRFPNVDPLIYKFPYLTPYNYASNSPIAKIDLYGLQGGFFNTLKDAAVSAAGSALGTMTAVVEDVTNVDLPEADEGILGSQGAKSFKEAEDFTHQGLYVLGSAATTIGLGASATGGVLTLTGAGAEVGIPIAASGIVTAAIGTWVSGNAIRNMSKGKNDNSKNEKHGDRGKAKTKIEKQVENLRNEARDAPNKIERKKIENKIKNINKTAEKKAKGEEHSRTKKQ